MGGPGGGPVEEGANGKCRMTDQVVPSFFGHGKLVPW